MGTARMVQEQRDKTEALTVRNEIKRKSRELASKREAMNAQIAQLRAQFAAESSEHETVIAEGRLAEHTLAEQRMVLTDMRASRAAHRSANGRKKAVQEEVAQSTKAPTQKDRVRVQTK